jgi:hypothetical protein
VAVAELRVIDDIRNDLGVAPDAESMCRLLHDRCERFGTVDAIDLLPLEKDDPGRVVCIVDMATAEQARAARTGEELAPLGANSLVCVVSNPRFPLPLPFHYAARRFRGA